jgi:hypothetical protein
MADYDSGEEGIPFPVKHRGTMDIYLLLIIIAVFILVIIGTSLCLLNLLKRYCKWNRSGKHEKLDESSGESTSYYNSGFEYHGPRQGNEINGFPSQLTQNRNLMQQFNVEPIMKPNSSNFSPAPLQSVDMDAGNSQIFLPAHLTDASGTAAAMWNTRRAFPFLRENENFQIFRANSKSKVGEEPTRYLPIPRVKPMSLNN